MNRPEQLSFLNIKDQSFASDVKVLKDIRIVSDSNGNENIEFIFINDVPLTVNRRLTAYVGNSIEAITYDVNEIIFVMTDGSEIRCSYSFTPSISPSLLPAIKTFNGFKKVVTEGMITFEGGLFKASVLGLNGDESMDLTIIGNNQNKIVPANIWTDVDNFTLANSTTSIPGASITTSLFTIPEGKYYVSGQISGIYQLTSNTSNCYAIARFYDVEEEVPLIVSSVQRTFDVSANGTGSTLNFNSYLYLTKPTTIAVQRKFTAEASAQFVSNNITWLSFSTLSIIKHG